MMQRLLLLALCGLMAFPPQVLAAVGCAAGASGSQADIAAGLQRASALSTRLREHVNRSAFDLDALLDGLDYEAGEIIAFVSDGVAFEQYAGLLRGPQGTLMSRAGNALDQSVLLARLLRDAGFDARVVRGNLTVAQAERLLARIRRERPDEPELGDVRAALSLLQEHGLIGPLPEQQLDLWVTGVEQAPDIATMPEFPRFVESARFVREQLQAVGAARPPVDGNPLVTEARDYFWVEYKEDVAEPWVSVHPAFGDDDGPGEVAVTATLADEVPAGLQHRLRLSLSIERRSAGTLEAVPVMTPWERPVANLVGTPLTIAGLPNSALNPDLANAPVAEVMASAAYFVPVVNGSVADGAWFFDRNGTLIDSTVASSPGAGVFRQVGEAFGSAIGELAGEKVVPALTAVWIDITLIDPQGRERHFRRTLLDRIGPAARASGAADVELDQDDDLQFLPLLQNHTLMVAAGRTPRAMAIDAALGQLQASQPGMEVLLSRTVAGADKAPVEQSRVTNIPAHWPGHLALLTRFDAIESWSSDHRIYRHEPLLAIHTAGPSGPAAAMARVDIVHSNRRALALTPPVPVHDPGALVAAGVWETQVEGSLLDPDGSPASTERVFALARDQGIALRTIGPRQQERAKELDLAPDALHHLNADLERGYAVIVPERIPEGLDQTGWWRVDPVTGETLGMLDDGRGVEVTEYMIVATFALISYALLKYQLYGCFSDYTPGAGQAELLACCVLANYAGYVVGTALGVGLALKVSEAWAGVAGLGLDVADIASGFDAAVCNAILN